VGSACIEGNALVCRQVNTRNFDGQVPPNILAFEQRVMRQHFPGQSLDQWERDPNYHAYLNLSALCPTSVASVDTAFTEYRHWPAPTREGRRSSPVNEGETSFAFANVNIAHGPRLPMPGGYVKHYLDMGSRALANATIQGRHVLHPGYIIRFITALGPGIMSTTIGRGIGAFASNNVVYGVRMFHELDQRIKSRVMANSMSNRRGLQ
jgi:hypothetical protein